MNPVNVEEFCRFCHANVRVKGTITNTRLIFEKKDVKEKSINERLMALGLTLFKSPLVSHRMCRSCFALLVRMEAEFPVFWRWEKEDKLEKENATAATASQTSTVLPATVKVPVPPSYSSPRDDGSAAESSGTDKRGREPTPSKTPRKIKKEMRPKPVTPVNPPPPTYYSIT